MFRRVTDYGDNGEKNSTAGRSKPLGSYGFCVGLVHFNPLKVHDDDAE
jgi:hypothetical protein